MITLSLDTTGPWCIAALVSEGGILAHKSENIGRGHAERIAPMVAEILADAGLSASDVDRVAVCTGPGSFTGLRVALAYARGFALPRKLPVIGISALHVLAAQADPDMTLKVISVINVKRGQLTWAAYDKGQEIQPPITQEAEEARSAIDALGYDMITGDGAEVLGLEPEATVLSGPIMGWLAENFTVETHPPVPLYSRPPDAKLPGGITPP